MSSHQIGLLILRFTIRGDLDGDGLATTADVPLVVNVLLGLDTDPHRLAAADVDENGMANGASIRLFVDTLLEE